MKLLSGPSVYSLYCRASKDQKRATCHKSAGILDRTLCSHGLGQLAENKSVTSCQTVLLQVSLLPTHRLAASYFNKFCE